MCKVGDVFGILGGATGPTAAEKAAANQSASMAKVLSNNYNTQFQNQNDMLQLLQGETQKIATGQTGEGFSAAENAAREGLIENNAAAGERNAQQQTQNNAAGLGGSMGGDTSGLARASGIRQQVAGEVATAGENNKSNALLANTAANYNQGRTNANEAAGLYGSLAGRYGASADSAMSGSISSNNAAFGQATQLHKESDAASPGAMIGGLIKAGIGIAGDVATGGMSGLMGSLSGGDGGGQEYGGDAASYGGWHDVPGGGEAGGGWGA